MPGNPKDMHVKVFLTPNATPPFHLDPPGPLTFVNNYHPGFHVHFHLQDPTHGYLFPPNNDKDKAVWSELGQGACPQAGVWEVFKPLHVTPNRKTLVVHNANVAPILGEFGYTLRVIDNSGNWLDLDPGGNNQNGPVRFDWSYVAVGVGSALVTSAVLAAAVSLAGFDLVCPGRY